MADRKSSIACASGARAHHGNPGDLTAHRARCDVINQVYKLRDVCIENLDKLPKDVRWAVEVYQDLYKRAVRLTGNDNWAATHKPRS